MPQQQSDSDLDRTDELPRLDVAAYEASMRERGEDPLARTDTWVVKALQDSDLPDDLDEDDAPTRHLRPVAEPTVRVRPIEPTRDVTAEVDSVFRRIDQLEKELDSARTEATQWQTRSSELTTERAEQEARAATLTSNNARLVEQQQIAYDRTQVLEVRMREEGDLAKQRFTELQTTLQTERGTHAEFKQTIENKLTSAHGQIETLTRTRSDLLTKLSTQSELAETR